jgi:hypothetical protein
LSLLALCPQAAKEPRHVETSRYKALPAYLDEIQKEIQKNDKAVVVWLVDHTKTFKTPGNADVLAAAIRKYPAKSKITHAVVAFGERVELVQRPSDDPAKAAAAIEAIVAAPPDDSIKNCLHAVREAAKVAAGGSGAKKYLILYTQENGDSEDEVEGTVRTLKSAGITFFAIAPEAVYSDPYWESAYSGSTYFFDMDRIKRLPFQLKGPECAFLEFPYGWPFTWADPAYTAPSGFGFWALNRLAAETSGKYFLHTVDRTHFSFCMRYGCTICGREHKGCDASFDVTKLLLTDPDVGSRAEYVARYSKDKLYLAILETWEKLHKEGILRGAPPFRFSGGGIVENKRPDNLSSAMGFGMSGSDWKSTRQQALKAAGKVHKEGNELFELSKKIGAASDKRITATSDAFVVHLAMLNQTFLQLAAFADEMDRHKAGQKPPGDGFASDNYDPPPNFEVVGYLWENVYLCHGGAPVKEIRFLGDLKDLHGALDFADQMIEKHRGTPWEVLMRRAYLPVFRPATRAKGGEMARERPRSSGGTNATPTPATPPARPQRPTQGGSSSGTGTQTGGNR